MLSTTFSPPHKKAECLYILRNRWFEDIHIKGGEIDIANLRVNTETFKKCSISFRQRGLVHIIQHRNRTDMEPEIGVLLHEQYIINYHPSPWNHMKFYEVRAETILKKKKRREHNLLKNKECVPFFLSFS